MVPVEVCEGIAKLMQSVEHTPTKKPEIRKKQKKGSAAPKQPVPPLNVKAAAAANIDIASSPDQPS